MERFSGESVLSISSYFVFGGDVLTWKARERQDESVASERIFFKKRGLTGDTHRKETIGSLLVLENRFRELDKYTARENKFPLVGENETGKVKL